MRPLGRIVGGYFPIVFHRAHEVESEVNCHGVDVGEISGGDEGSLETVGFRRPLYVCSLELVCAEGERKRRLPFVRVSVPRGL